MRRGSALLFLLLFQFILAGQWTQNQTIKNQVLQPKQVEIVYLPAVTIAPILIELERYRVVYILGGLAHGLIRVLR